jgi:hypothetical protein
MTSTGATPTERRLHERRLATTIACGEHFAAASDGARDFRAPGLAAAVFPTGRERTVYNNAVLERDLRLIPPP